MALPALPETSCFWLVVNPVAPHAPCQPFAGEEMHRRWLFDDLYKSSHEREILAKQSVQVLEMRPLQELDAVRKLLG